ncbi:universal stress protein [Desulfosporosinus fructosivorans]|uniref:universal stress protein n=1 Tax=Desulfosporosinus fructosivorans TaxID=2018669 RepID=UPI00130D57C3|nr:universal stress protein [Desulfosporosinus fructosivorans]
MKKILVATDGSEYSRRALKTAVDLARKFDSEIEILFVIRMPKEYDTNIYNYQILLEQIEEEGERTIVATFEGTDLIGVTLKSKKLHGNPGNVIIQEVENENIDLVVMGSHIQEFFRAGCDDYISKPVDLGVLQRKLEEFIARQEA